MKADDSYRPSTHKLQDVSTRGLTVRDHIAIEAMNGLAAQAMEVAAEQQKTPVEGVEKLAIMSYMVADAMLKQSEEK